MAMEQKQENGIHPNNNRLLVQGKSKMKLKRLSKSDLAERVRILYVPETDSICRGFKPIVPTSDMLKAARAKKMLQKKAIEKERKKAEAAASGIDWLSDDSDDEPQKPNTESPLCEIITKMNDITS